MSPAAPNDYQRAEQAILAVLTQRQRADAATVIVEAEQRSGASAQVLRQVLQTLVGRHVVRLNDDLLLERTA